MIIQADPPVHLTYCLNVHPGESWAENFQAMRTHALAVRDRVCPGKPFALGLRLGRQAATELTDAPHLRDQLRDFLRRENLYVFTINGFPYGPFHGTPVKQEVYRPDWRSALRRDYTIALADLLADLLPAGVDGSISTLSLSYRAWMQSDRDERFVQTCVEMLCDVAAHMASLQTRTSRRLCLAMEAEADCVIETTAQTIEFFTGPLRQLGVPYLRQRHNFSAEQAEKAISSHLGVCLDTAHLAVQFEDPAEAMDQLLTHGIRLAKVQISAALETEASEATLRRLADFADPVYLHQVKVQAPSGQLTAHADLGDALASSPARAAGNCWRVHFHVPLFFEGYQGLNSTRRTLGTRFWGMLRDGRCSGWEIETYTMNVLPDFLRPPDVAQAIAMEFDWVSRQCSGI